MLTITRGLDFSVSHTVKDSVDGQESDLRGYVLKSQVRYNTAINQEYPLLIDLDVISSGLKNSVFALHLSREETLSLPLGDYLVDVVATKDGRDEFLLRKEAIKVVGYVTLPEDVGDVPNFVDIFLTALND